MILKQRWMLRIFSFQVLCYLPRIIQLCVAIYKYRNLQMASSSDIDVACIKVAETGLLVSMS